VRQGGGAYAVRIAQASGTKADPAIANGAQAGVSDCVRHCIRGTYTCTLPGGTLVDEACFTLFQNHRNQKPFGGTRGTDCRQMPVTNVVSVLLGVGLISKTQKLQKRQKKTTRVRMRGVLAILISLDSGKSRGTLHAG
jgi:hypothetical protein